MKAIYPGSFDPITLGHLDIIERVSKLYDEVIVLVARSSNKDSLFTTAEKVALIKDQLKKIKNVKVDSFDGLIVEYAKKKGAQVIIRGLRAVVDFEYELSMGNINKKLAPDIETVLVFASPEFYFISSRMVKEVAKNQGPLKELVAEKVAAAIRKKIGNQ